MNSQYWPYASDPATAAGQQESSATTPPTIAYVTPTPMTSPATAYITPDPSTLHLMAHTDTVGLSVTAPPTRRTLPPRTQVTEPVPALSARMLLDMNMPASKWSVYGTGRASSAANMYYPNVGVIEEFTLPDDLSGYEQLPTTFRYHSAQEDPTLAPSIEADVIKAIYNIVFAPVNRVLYDTTYTLIDGYQCPIRSVSEDTHTVKVVLNPNNPDHSTVSHVSRVDYSWQVFLDGYWQKFMLMELKRPGVLIGHDWQDAFAARRAVKGYGEKCCRQTVKYAYGFDVPFIGICDGRSLVLLELDLAGKAEWFNPSGAPRPIRTRGTWVMSEDMRRYLYIFMKYALKCCLLRRSKTIVA